MKFSRCETHRWQANFAAPQSELISVSLAPAYFEAVSIALARRIREGMNFQLEKLSGTIPEVLQREEFKKFTGPGSSKKSDLEGRIAYVYSSLA